MIKEDMYNGELVREAPLPQTVLPRDLSSRTVAEGWQQVGKNIDHAFFTGVQMEDARKEFEASLLMDAIEDDVKSKVEAGLSAKDGDDISFFDKTGKIRLGLLDNIRSEVQKAMGGVGAMIVDPNVRNRVQARAMESARRMQSGLDETWKRVNKEKTEQAWRDAYDLAAIKGNYDESIALLGRGVDLGLFSRTRAEVMQVRLEQDRERKRLAALKAAGKAEDGRVVTAEMMQSLQRKPEQESVGDVSGLVSAIGRKEENADSLQFSAGKEQDVLTMKDAGMAVLPPDELVAGFNVAQRLADSGAVTVNAKGGLLEFALPPSPGESTQKVAGVAQAFKGYSLADYRNSIAKVAAGYFSDDGMVGMTDAQLVDALVDEVQMDGAADAWFEGDVLAYKGWLKTELSRLSVTRGSGAVRAADRLLVGAEGRAGLNELLAQEVTQDEIASLGYGFNAVASITKGGLRDKNDVLAPGFQQAVLEYERYRERWSKELAAADSKCTPSDEDTPGKRYKDDWQEFGRWYMKQADLYKSRVDALEEGVRDVYRQRAVDAVSTLRLSGSYQLGTEVVQLDGKSDWAQEEKVLRYVLRQPLTNSELGTARALTATKERLYQERRNRAATYAKAAAEHKELLKGKKAAMAEEKARAKQEKKGAEELEKVLKQADDDRLSGYGRKVERKVKFGSVGKAGEDEPAVVVVPRVMYAEAAGALGASDGGFYAFLPGVDDGIPVMAGDVNTIQFNAPVLNLLDGKKNKLTGQQLRALANEGLMVPVQFSAFQKF